MGLAFMSLALLSLVSLPATALVIKAPAVKIVISAQGSGDPLALAESDMPTWRKGQAVSEWRQVPGTAMSSIEPSPMPAGNTGPRSKVIAWTSFVVDPRDSKVYSLANGGHNDYSGNEVDALELEPNAPKWTNVVAPTPAAKVIKNADYYADGRPTSRHSYYGVVFNPTTNSFMLFGGARWDDNGGGTRVCDKFNIDSKSWSPQGSIPDASSIVFAYAAAPHIVDPSSGDVYNFGNYIATKWSKSTNTWSTISQQGYWAYNAMSALDTTRGKVLFLGGQEKEHFTYQISTNTFQNITPIGANSAEILNIQEGSLIYVKAIDRFFARGGSAGSTIYVINPANFEVTTLATVGGNSIPSTINGPFNKFLYIPRLKGAVYVPDYDSNAWFIRLY